MDILGTSYIHMCLEMDAAGRFIGGVGSEVGPGHLYGRNMQAGGGDIPAESGVHATM